LVREYGPSEGFERADEIYAPFVLIDGGCGGAPRAYRDRWRRVGPPSAAKCELVMTKQIVTSTVNRASLEHAR